MDYTNIMTFLGTLIVFMLFFALIGIGVFITKRTFGGCACKSTMNENSCCKKETCTDDCAAPEPPKEKPGK